MNMTDIKTQLGIPTIMLVRQKEQDSDTPTQWLSHWENEKRIRVTVHEDVLAEIKKKADRNDLAIKRQVVGAKVENGVTTRESYVRYVVIIPTNVEATF
jgi:heme-degrading monooxygenase HmoA